MGVEHEAAGVAACRSPSLVKILRCASLSVLLKSAAASWQAGLVQMSSGALAVV